MSKNTHMVSVPIDDYNELIEIKNRKDIHMRVYIYNKDFKYLDDIVRFVFEEDHELQSTVNKMVDRLNKKYKDVKIESERFKKSVFYKLYQLFEKSKKRGVMYEEND